MKDNFEAQNLVNTFFFVRDNFKVQAIVNKFFLVREKFEMQALVNALFLREIILMQKYLFHPLRVSMEDLPSGHSHGRCHVRAP